MKNVFFKLLLLIIVLILSSGEILAQVNWTKYEGNPVIPSGPSGSWYSGVITPCVLYNTDSLRYEMWFAGSVTTTGLRPHRIGFAYSNDGISWVIHPDPVLTPRPSNWDNYSVYAPWVVRENGLFKMWYTHEAPGYTNYKLGYATSSDGINWTRFDYPVMEAGTAEWEAQGVGHCSVLPVTGGYKMWYSGLAGSTDTISIGYAVSTDGITWQRDTVNNPILSPGSAGQWDDFNIFAPRVIILDNVYYMYYGAARESFGQYRVGLATSTDGLDWDKYSNNPVLKPSQSGWDNGEVETGCVVQMGDTLYMWYDGSNSGTYHWQIGLATSSLVSSVEQETTLPTEYILSQNYPNPFNPSTKIKYSVPQSSNVVIKVFDILGNEIETLVNEEKSVGTYEITWYAENLPSGVYFYQLKAGSFIETKKMVLLK
ncbi:MAG: T9SS type A sorting domain-containing protein [Ignavibacteriaceae bacterium]|nr:T9SS type A sorting domain-containing protein [Ignavibacteriaceae bacterium]